MTRLFVWWATLPEPMRSAIVDAGESGVAAAAAVEWALPTSTNGLVHVGGLLLGAFVGAFVSNLRRRAQASIAARRAA